MLIIKGKVFSMLRLSFLFVFCSLIANAQQKQFQGRYPTHGKTLTSLTNTTPPMDLLIPLAPFIPIWKCI